MARYEGMDELLQRVRERLGEEPGEIDSRSGQFPMPSAHYETALNGILSLLHESEQLHATLKAPEYTDLPMAQIEDLLSILDKVQRELRRCEAVIQR